MACSATPVMLLRKHLQQLLFALPFSIPILGATLQQSGTIRLTWCSVALGITVSLHHVFPVLFLLQLLSLLAAFVLSLQHVLLEWLPQRAMGREMPP